jgi:hypothetical protein
MGDSVFNTNTTTKDFEVIGHIMKDTPIEATVETNLNKVTLTVKVDENATGFVEVKYGDGVLNIALENGVGIFTTELPYGSYSLDITYLGDANYNKNSTKSEFTLVEPAKATTPISLDVVTGENDVTMTVSVNDAATGLVKFQVTGDEEYVVYADVVNGKAVLEDILAAGDYTVVATYMGDNRFNTNITYADFTVRGHIKKDTPITAYADVIGNRVTLTVNVDENATGFVKLSVGDLVANVELVDGVAKITTTFMANSYFVDVDYLGDENFNANATKLAFTVTEVSKKNTDIGLKVTVDENSAMVNVELNNSVTGLVKFYVVSKESGENLIFYMDVKEGHVGLFVDDIVPGNYTVIATYMGDSVFNTNVTFNDFEVFGHVMKDTPIAATVETSANTVTLTVKVDENATGFVEIKYGDTSFNLALENGECSLTTELPYGSYSLDITYLGDENYNRNSTKSEFTLVEPSKENTPISLDIVTGENDVAMTVSVNDAATGLVKFQVTGDEEYVVYADVVNGKAVLESIFATGDYTVVATYMGDNRFNTNITYGDFTVRGHIKKDTPITAYADVIGNRVTVTVSVDENATGFVKLSVGGTDANLELVDGVATVTSTLPANSYFVDVTYLGDDNYNMANTKLTFTVTDISKVNTTIDLNVAVDENIALFDVDLNKSATGLVKFYIINKESGENDTVYIDVKDGYAEIFAGDLVPGNYTVVVTYMGDSVFNTNMTSADFTIEIPEKQDTNVSIVVPENIKAGENVTVKINIPGNTGNVSVIVDGVENVVVLDDNGTASVPISNVGAGNHSVVIIYPGDGKHDAVYKATTFNVEGEAVEPKNITVVVDGVSYPAKIVNGTVVIDTNATEPVTAERLGTVLIAEDFEQYSCDHTIGERGRNFTGQLLDSNGVPLANKVILIGYNGVNFNRTTNATGHFAVQIGLQNAGLYTFAMSFLDDAQYNASFLVKGINIIKKPTSIVAKNAKFKAKTKTKKLTVRLKTILGASIDGKIYLKEGKKIKNKS